MIVKIPIEHHLEVSSLTGGCSLQLSKSRASAQIILSSFFVHFLYLRKTAKRYVEDTF